MRSASRQGKCGGQQTTSRAVQPFRLSTTTTATPTVAPAASFTPAPAAAAPAPSPPAARQRPQQGVMGVHESSPPAQRPAQKVGRSVASAAPSHGRGLVIALVLLLLAANLLAGGVWLLRKRAERGGYGYVGPIREFDDPGRELDFGQGEKEASERPAEAEDAPSRSPRP